MATFHVRHAPPTQQRKPPDREGKDSPYSQENKSFSGFLKHINKARNANYFNERENSWDILEKVYGVSHQNQRSAVVAKTAMGEESGILGGFLVPRELTVRLLETFAEESFIYPRANVIPMNAAELLCPKIDVETVPASAGISPFFGGINFAWGSGDPATETEPTFRQLSLKAWDLLGYAVVSNQFIDDAGPEADEYLVKLFGKAAAWYAEYAFLRGTGTGTQMPLGILNAPALIQVTRTTASQINNADIATMASRLIPFSWNNAIWATHPTCLTQIFQLPNYQANTGLTRERGATGELYTRPLFVTEKLPSLGNPGDLVLFDPWLYVIGNRMEVLIDVSTHVSFQNYQTNFRVWMRLAGEPQVSSSITLQDATTTASPYLALR